LQLFGQSIFSSAKKVLIVEGELDAMSAWQMFQGGKYTKGVAVLSLPLGANLKAVSDNLKYLKANYKEITFCFDNDKAGQDASKLMANLMPSAKFMEISEKDANDMLTKGKEADFISAFFSAEIYKPDTIVRVVDVMDRVMMKPTMGEPWPWKTLTAKTYGRNPGQGIYVGAGVKIGKSEFINQVVTFDVQRGKKIAVLKYEEPPFMTVKRVAGKIDGTFYHKPDVNYSDVALKATALSMQDLLIMYPAFGSATWETTKDFIRYAAMMGCETIIIDPITKLTNTLTSSETETELRKLSDELACMAQDMGFFYIVTCHLKTPYSGPPHERGGKVQSSQFRGSRAMMENTYYMMGIERDKDPLLTLVEQNTSTFVLLEDRNFGNSASFPVQYDPINQGYLEPSVTLKF
jgi:twinkle protein